MNHLEPEAEPDAEPADTGRLREALAAAAYDVTPSRVPLAAVERRGRLLRRRRRTTVLGGGCAVLLAPLAFVTLHDDLDHRATRPATTVSASPQPSASPSAPAPTPRIVEPGERVTVAPGFVLWLTEEGKHWTTPENPVPEFRSVTTDNIDRNSPGVTVQSESSPTRAYLSGLYYGGEGTASVVEVASKDGPVRGGLLELPGNPGWGVWYAVADTGVDHLARVTVRTTEGRVYAHFP
ncbi:hypothetical protein ABZ473_25625 [Streptomyces cellulosae]